MKPTTWVCALAVTGLVLISFRNFDKIHTGTNKQTMMTAVQESSTPEKIRMTAETSSTVITALIHQDTQIDDLCLSMKTLTNIQGSLTAPVLIFGFGALPVQQDQDYLQSCTDRAVSFAAVDGNDFPDGFSPEGGKDYSSSHVNRFWTTKIWEHTAIEPYNIIMRIDHDTCFSLPNSDLPEFKSPNYVYNSHHFPGTKELNTRLLNGMYDYTDEYMLNNNLQPGHNALWEEVKFIHQNTRSLPNFLGSFELARKDFMQRQDVSAFHYALTDMPPYGYFSKGWDMDAERFLTMAIFGTPTSVDSSVVPGFMQKSLVTGTRHDKMCTTPFEVSR